MNKKTINNELELAINGSNKSIYALIRFYFTSFFKSVIPYTTILIMILSVIILMTLFPTYLMIIGSFSLVLVITVLITWGYTFFILRRSTLYKNLLTSKFTIYTLYVSMIIFVFAWVLILAILQLALVLILDFFGILSHGWGWSTIENPINWSTAAWGVFIYYLIIAIILAIAISFFFQTLSKSLKGYMFLSLTYFVFSIVFGGLLFAELSSVAYNESTSSWYIVRDSSPENGNYMGTPWTSISWYFSLLTPHYYINTLAYTTFWSWEILLETGETIIIHANDISYLHFQYWEWIMIILMPYLYMVALVMSGLIITKKKPKDF